MLQDTYTPPTPEQRRSILTEYGFTYDERIREAKCKQITSVSRATRWQLENAGKFPPRCHLGRNSCAWLLSDVLWWVRNPPAIKGVNNPHERKKEKEAGENAK
ncbi:AlpA family phage regulatory protein [Hafnia paralvei]|uniref:helix-turn-helix transcriptional regulator n=1 Tax=Hafnia paralvei TaxID=546367 RepID=UPI001584BA6A|nr:AlpA family phage regulatory protein [Hafnia paralvei]NUN41272.1 AlpA family phage regulatory protein [Hafnia paralvei]